MKSTYPFSFRFSRSLVPALLLSLGAVRAFGFAGGGIWSTAEGRFL